ncbi:hypothetical protein Cgig2_009021 [Carnegiea gigantea]|uniref:Retrotransposon gag domain-containing protein n=1 Tax=Carnegiea gigantea TaxID=171969 RepID=A0A9Q1KF18_9CARY|nr:hypothetical protein Cgig2_009021 [Carnegiea gigantea]
MEMERRLGFELSRSSARRIYMRRQGKENKGSREFHEATPAFDYELTRGVKPLETRPCRSQHENNSLRDAARPWISKRPHDDNHDRTVGMDARRSSGLDRLFRRPELIWHCPQPPPCRMRPIPSARLGLKNRSKLYDLMGKLMKGGIRLSSSQPMTAAPKPYNARKYCEFYEQNGHTTIECRELKKALHELADKGAFRKDPVRACEEPQEEKCSIEIMAKITGEHVEGISCAMWKA